jgi:hypothetical protein
MPALQFPVLFTFLQNTFGWLSINGHDVNKRAEEINFHLTKGVGGQNVPPQAGFPVLPAVAPALECTVQQITGLNIYYAGSFKRDAPVLIAYNYKTT